MRIPSFSLLAAAFLPLPALAADFSEASSFVESPLFSTRASHLEDAKAEDEKAGSGWDKWHLTADLTYASRYVAVGFGIGGDHPAFQPMVKLDTPLEGVALKVWTSLQAERNNKEFDEYDYMLCYSHGFFSDKDYAVGVDGYADFWDYPNAKIGVNRYGNAIDPKRKQGEKYRAGFSLPNLIPLAGSHLVPSYHYSYWTPLDGKLFQPGGMHEIGLDYSHDLPAFIPGVKAQSASVGGTMNYHDGVFGVTPGWSHATLGVNTSAAILPGLTGGVGVNYQWTFEKTVNPDDMFWYTASVTYTF